MLYGLLALLILVKQKEENNVFFFGENSVFLCALILSSSVIKLACSSQFLFFSEKYENYKTWPLASIFACTVQSHVNNQSPACPRLQSVTIDPIDEVPIQLLVVSALLRCCLPSCVLRHQTSIIPTGRLSKLSDQVGSLKY